MSAGPAEGDAGRRDGGARGAPPAGETIPARSASVAETERLGECLASALEVGDVLALVGPLGAGKTRFVAGLARGLGAPGRVRSPSFTLVNEYRGRIGLLHLDLYRLEERDVQGLGVEEGLERGALVVEWGDKLPDRLREESLEIRFAVVSPTERDLVAGASGARGRELLASWRGCAGSGPNA